MTGRRVTETQRKNKYLCDSVSRWLVAVVCAFAILVAACRATPPPAADVTVFEGARLITGDGSAPIDDSAFIVQKDQFTWAGRRADLQAPAGATRVDLRGKTVMPTMVDLHGHIGFQNIRSEEHTSELQSRLHLV